MRLKEIKPGMAIHCKNDEEKKVLLEEAERLGYKWNDGLSATDCSSIRSSGMTIHFHGKDENCDFAYIAWSNKTEGVTEFSDLILPELTTEEVLLIRNELSFEFVREYLGLSYGRNLDKMLRTATPEQIIDMCQKWKSDHEKKEPKIETVDICRIIKTEPNGFKRCVHEEDIIPEPDGGEQAAVENILKRYLMEHEGEYIAVHEVVSRVKAVK